MLFVITFSTEQLLVNPVGIAQPDMSFKVKTKYIATLASHKKESNELEKKKKKKKQWEAESEMDA